MSHTRSLPGLASAEEERELLRLPVESLLERCRQQMDEHDLFGRAGRSGLYRQAWRTAGVPVAQLRGREDLRRLPFLEGADLKAMVASGSAVRRALAALPRAWVTSHGSGVGTKKWLPLTLGDTADWFGRVVRANEALGMGSRGNVVVLAINDPLPHVSNALPYLWERADYLCGGRRLEFLIVTIYSLGRTHWDRFAAQKRPGWIMASVADARRLAQELGPAAKDLLDQPCRGVFWGAPLDGPEGARADLQAAFGLAESFSLYFSAECREMYTECSAHSGLHLWLDRAIHEVIPEGEAQALPIEQAAPGTEGEYVVTTLGEALPLVRYRTGDRIRVIGHDACACGATHPRVLFLGRRCRD